MNKRWLLFALLLALGPLAAQSPAREQTDQEALTRLLHEFLAGASRNDIPAHERFWDDDLVYTSSAGKRFGKAEILQELRAGESEGASEPQTDYSAEDIRIRVYGDTAVVAFRLVGASRNGSAEAMQYLNTGTFARRGDEWRAVAWQATRMPGTE